MRTSRINAIDAARGLCLLNIFVNHITVGVLLELSPSKIAFCDSADVFVFLAGMSTFLAYGSAVEVPWQRMWRRALTLYLANLGVLAASFAILALSAAGAVPREPEVAPSAILAAAGPLDFVWHAVTMQQSIGYSMVLRLYVFLMLAAPLYVWLARKRFWYPLVAAAAVWLPSGHAGLIGYDAFTGRLLSMNILTWQFVFAAGVALAAAIAQGVPLPRSRLLTAGAALFVLGGTWLIVMGSEISPGLLAWLEDRNDYFWTGISKSLQSPLRLGYLFCLVYLVMALAEAPVVRLLHRAGPDNLFCRLGRRSLPVFAFGAIYALALDELLWNLIARGMVERGAASAILVELVLAALGFRLMLAIADGSLRQSAARQDRPQPLNAFSRATP